MKTRKCHIVFVYWIVLCFNNDFHKNPVPVLWECLWRIYYLDTFSHTLIEVLKKKKKKVEVFCSLYKPSFDFFFLFSSSHIIVQTP